MVEYIEYGDEKLPVRLTFTAINKFQEETNQSIEALGHMETNLKLLEPLLYYGLEEGFKAEKKEFTIKRQDMSDILDETWQCFLINIDKFIYFGKSPNTVSKKK